MCSVRLAALAAPSRMSSSRQLPAGASGRPTTFSISPSTAERQRRALALDRVAARASAPLARSRRTTPAARPSSARKVTRVRATAVRSRLQALRQQQRQPADHLVRAARERRQRRAGARRVGAACRRSRRRARRSCRSEHRLRRSRAPDRPRLAQRVLDRHRSGILALLELVGVGSPIVNGTPRRSSIARRCGEREASTRGRRSATMPRGHSRGPGRTAPSRAWPTPASPSRAPCSRPSRSRSRRGSSRARPRAGSVAPITWRAALTASMPSSTIATIGPEVMNSHELTEERPLGVLGVVALGQLARDGHVAQRGDASVPCARSGRRSRRSGPGRRRRA